MYFSIRLIKDLLSQSKYRPFIGGLQVCFRLPFTQLFCDKIKSLCGGSMRKYIPLVLLFLAFAFLNQTDAYTVVLKSGKVINGTLISESADAIVFKDDSGIQYSLKKSSLDLGKMEQANAPKTEPAQPEPTPEKPAEKKKAKVYTKEDVDALRAKY